MANKEIAVKVQDLTKTFRIPLEASSGIKQKLINTLKGRKGYREFTPLNDISFEIEKGDFFGIVGRNGSGKSTLLKTIAGIYAPDEGLVQVNGKLVPFIELGVGFNPELTGRENVFLNGALLGFSRKEMEAMYDEIVEFAELGEFMEERLKNYSSGMQVRLAFSIAIRARGDILLLDEVLAVGDSNFQQKCFNYFRELKRQNHTVILVSHDRNAIITYCTKCVLLEKGKIISSGKPSEVLDKYEEIMLQDSIKNTVDLDTKENADTKEPKYAQIKSVDINTPENKKYFIQDEKIEITITYQINHNLDNPIFGLILKKKYDQSMLVTNTRTKEIKTGSINAGVTSKLKYEFINKLGNDKYSIEASIASEDGGVVYDTKYKDDEIIVSGNKDHDAVIVFADNIGVSHGE